MNKFYFQIGHLFLALYNDKNTDIDIKYRLLEHMKEMVDITQNCLIEGKSKEDFKQVLLDELYKDRKNAINVYD